ncbi:MAG: NnrS family protein [Gammaproteobacteria bacterium]|nr:NnrS family protein [Gammaproteobacteria bacterium]MBT3490225.1 NnrS family protein [Gammaproteobacteria bacterium]MBT3719818.1 NnrS family protein [Gammaproteobacteria bacterium]MBT3845666.1 NnrS family protein [Gammaproteobacteria bacterium]MBT3893105.1 NnrS family protein [Gammaproteobacteria bacterium]
MILNIEQPSDAPPPFALFQLGFRPFFLGAALYSVIAVLFWTLAYSFQWSPSAIQQWGNPFWWHGHEMIFGYGMAVVAGFLLTASMNWTGVQTIRFTPLTLLFASWLLARLLPWIPGATLSMVALFDLLFLLALTAAVTHPLYKARQWDQVRIFTSKLSLVFVCNLTFYLGMFNYIEGGERIGLYGATYLILALILTLGRRVFPFFIEKGVNHDGSGSSITLKNSKLLDLSSLTLFLLFALADLFISQTQVIGGLALALVVIHSIRFYNWYTPHIWKKPLLWVLMVGYGWMIIGFLLKALATAGFVSPYLALHAFTYGAVGTVTIGMMARVSLGHTGRSVFNPPKGLNLIFGLLTAGAFVRILLPLLYPQQSINWMLLSQLLWTATFSLFAWHYATMLIRPRIDGRPG